MNYSVQLHSTHRQSIDIFIKHQVSNQIHCSYWQRILLACRHLL